ncbi:MAG TPA: patatin-like phospholipase family protein [Smithella sp.]|nr:patatin-like phospholipase family protein [Smithella sp.]NMC96280.1 patatin [Deltaproteobacteria bacterium]HNQ65554.1 patatin-like phospholipase family protein [Smithella sp.]HOE32987.1 patatin-like phospholipase family protein [Smithella sp.]HOG09043.1 patatin-like phospholipase family protein [Smithella sp.]
MGKKVGLVLGGGGVRGFSHIGVLKVLEEEGIDIDLIVGTSAGALIGGAYASGQAPDEIESKIDAYLQSPEFDDSRMKSIGLSFTQEEKNILKKAQQFIMNRVLFVQAFFKPSILPSHDFLSLMNYFLPDLDIKETRIPLHVVSTDLISGKKIVFSEGSLRKVVLASCAVPGAVEPVRYGDWLLADGGITSLVPVHAAREAGADVVIAVTVDRDLQTNLRIETAKDVVFRAGEITPSVLEAAELADADVIIRPQVGNLHWMDFKRAVDLVKAGESAARDSLKSIHASLPIYRRITRLAGKLFKQSRL